MDFKRNRWAFGIGTIGRDMVYSLVSTYLIFYLTDAIYVPTASLWWINGIILFARIFDAANDPLMGLVVDNTRTRFGKFKPWIAFGAFFSGIATVLMFLGFSLDSPKNVALFGLLYIAWGIFYTTNDISYWSMLPSLSAKQSEREKIGAIARICANIGLFFVVAGIIPLTQAFSSLLGSSQKGYLAFAALTVAVMWAGQLATLIFAKQPKAPDGANSRTYLREMAKIIFKNDQLLFTALSMILFMIGYMTTAAFGIYYFKYVYGQESMYTYFALILGVSQLSAITAFPFLSKRFERDYLFKLSMALIAAGYILFFFSPTGTMLFIGPAGILIFVGQAFIQVLMLMFLADSVDYGHWKLGKRNDSLSFSLQPFINKSGGALSNAIVGAVVILSGMKDADSAQDISAGGIVAVKAAMLLFPMICIFLSYLIYRAKYKLDRKFYEYISWELENGRTKESE
ncbi:MAG: glycoside-pentoside-hexuronide (GPH):cation symporter [Clostridiales bacterium]|jgi:melibiose permease/lactose/raffinose/galactose permease|nr:glycoside-pentoside-hexuronide (GPH):cation symporter [Clostridiales bacterium]